MVISFDFWQFCELLVKEPEFILLSYIHGQHLRVVFFLYGF